MSDDREFLRATTDWLEAGSDRTPPKAVDAVLLAVRTTRQDRVLRSPWRPIDMNALVKALVVATAVVAIALAWINFGPSGTSSIGVLPAPTPHAQPHANADRSSRTATAARSMPAGRYAFPSRATNPEISFTMPSGWTGLAGRTIRLGPRVEGLWDDSGRTPPPAVPVRLSPLTTGSRTRAPTTRPSCRPRDPGPPGSSASSRLSRASTPGPITT